MPIEKYIIVSDCRIAGEHTPKGTVLELDPNKKADVDLIGILNRNGRIGICTPKNEKFIQDEIKREAAERQRQIEERARSNDAVMDLAKRLVKVLQPA